jgi:hypothetical protein
MSHPSVPATVTKGPCPADVDGIALYKTRKCFPHDPKCGCHGPTFTKGMVGWAGGAGGGPHFFIYVDDAPATHWSHDHTVWGELADAQSMRVVQSILKSFPIDEGSGMAMLLHPIAFTLHVEAALDPALEAASAGSIEGGAQGSSSRGGGMRRMCMRPCSSVCRSSSSWANPPSPPNGARQCCRYP